MQTIQVTVHLAEVSLERQLGLLCTGLGVPSKVQNRVLIPNHKAFQHPLGLVQTEERESLAPRKPGTATHQKKKSHRPPIG